MVRPLTFLGSGGAHLAYGPPLDLLGQRGQGEQVDCEHPPDGHVLVLRLGREVVVVHVQQPHGNGRQQQALGKLHLEGKLLNLHRTLARVLRQVHPQPHLRTCMAIPRINSKDT
eukprot:2530961-Pyramimonas_sp.AAC.2